MKFTDEELLTLMKKIDPETGRLPPGIRKLVDGILAAVQKPEGATVADPTMRVHRFHPEGLDPITVYVEACRPGASRVTVQCYAQAWTAYWVRTGHDQSKGSSPARTQTTLLTDSCGATTG